MVCPKQQMNSSRLICDIYTTQCINELLNVMKLEIRALWLRVLCRKNITNKIEKTLLQIITHLLQQQVLLNKIPHAIVPSSGQIFFTIALLKYLHHHPRNSRTRTLVLTVGSKAQNIIAKFSEPSRPVFLSWEHPSSLNPHTQDPDDLDIFLYCDHFKIISHFILILYGLFRK